MLGAGWSWMKWSLRDSSGGKEAPVTAHWQSKATARTAIGYVQCYVILWQIHCTVVGLDDHVTSHRQEARWHFTQARSMVKWAAQYGAGQWGEPNHPSIKMLRSRNQLNSLLITLTALSIYLIRFPCQALLVVQPIKPSNQHPFVSPAMSPDDHLQAFDPRTQSHRTPISSDDRNEILPNLTGALTLQPEISLF